MTSVMTKEINLVKLQTTNPLLRKELPRRNMLPMTKFFMVLKLVKLNKKAIKKINHVMNDYANDKVDELDVQMKI